MNFKTFLLTLFLSIYVSTDHVESYDLNNYRLPTWAYPASYEIYIDLRNPDADTFRGYTKININVTEENHSELVLNVDPLYIDVNSSTITVDSSSSKCDKVDYSNITQLMVLTCTQDMWGNNTQYAQFEMNYTAKFSDSVGGLYKHTYVINETQKTVFFTHFEPTKFRRVFPSFDEPSFKAPFRVSVDHYENLTVASNMREEDTTNQVGYVETGFQVTPLMSSYLVAVVAGSSAEWEHVLVPGSNYLRIFMQRIHEAYISIVHQNGQDLLDKMGEWTGIEYPDLGNRRMTIAALPGMGGAMENWGLLTFAEQYLIDEGDRTTSKSLIKILTTMAHEMSHQWFGDYVTLNWWSEAWLNEGFASYFEWYLADMLSTDGNDYEFDTLFVIEELQPALQGDGPNNIPLSNNDSNINTPSEISGAFSTSITYNKGGCVLRMLRYALGEEVFQKGVREYLKAKALDNAKASDLLQHLQEALPNTTDIDLPTYMDSWIHQPDYPIVKTSFGEADANNYLISMDIYKYAPTINETREQNQSIWWVPISYITSANPDPSNATYFWINPGRTFEMTISQEEGSWGVVNAGATGFYRVDYDIQTLARIMYVLNNSDTYANIATENRAQILDDLFNVAKFYSFTSEGYSDRPYQNAFQVAEYLKYETEYIPWYTYLKEVQYLLDEIQDDLTKETLKEDVLALIEAQLIIPDPTDTTVLPHSEVLKRSLLLNWASKLNNTNALAYVNTQYTNFLKDTKSIASNYRDVVLCYGIKNSDDWGKDYITLMDLYEKSFLPQEKNDIAISISCIADTDFLKSYLASTLTAVPPIDKQYWAAMFTATYLRSPEGLDAALYFLVNHIDDISQKWQGAMKIEGMFSSIASKIIKPEHIKMLQNLLSKNSLNPNLVQVIEGAVKKAEVNVEWLDKFGEEITSIVVYDGNTVPTTGPTTDSTTTTTEKVSTTTPGAGVNIYNKFSVFVILSVSLIFKQFF